MTADFRRQFTCAFVGTILIFAFCAGIWYVQSTSVFMAQQTAVSGSVGAADGGTGFFDIVLCLRDVARGICPYVVFIVDGFIFLCGEVCKAVT